MKVRRQREGNKAAIRLPSPGCVLRPGLPLSSRSPTTWLPFRAAR